MPDHPHLKLWQENFLSPKVKLSFGVVVVGGMACKTTPNHPKVWQENFLSPKSQVESEVEFVQYIFVKTNLNICLSYLNILSYFSQNQFKHTWRSFTFNPIQQNIWVTISRYNPAMCFKFPLQKQCSLQKQLGKWDQYTLVLYLYINPVEFRCGGGGYGMQDHHTPPHHHHCHLKLWQENFLSLKGQVEFWGGGGGGRGIMACLTTPTPPQSLTRKFSKSKKSTWV